MDVESSSLRALMAGVLGGIAAIWICARMAAWMPKCSNGKCGSTLLSENKFSILAANIAFLIGICLGIALYQFGIFDNSDWRGFALGAGGGCMAALMVIPIQAMLGGRKLTEAYVAFAISQRTPTVVLYAIVIAGVAGFAAAIATI